MKTNRDVQSKDNDTLAAIGIGAMIVFIALILVAAVAAAVIIQTAEKLQQNAQTAGDDTADEMAGKLMINAAYVGTGSGTAVTDEYHLLLRLGPGSEPTLPSAISFQVFCENGIVEGTLASTDVHTMEDETDLATATTPMDVGVGYIVYIDAVKTVGATTTDCGPDEVTTAELYLHVERGGTTFETLTIDDTSPGALVV